MLTHNPCSSLEVPEKTHYTDQLPAPALILGDFNARHKLWDQQLSSSMHNVSGTSLFNFLLQSSRFSLLSHEGQGTRVDPHTERASVLDLCLGESQFIGPTFSLGPYMGSDHLPLLVRFPDMKVSGRLQTLPHWRLVNTGWPI